MGPIRHLRHKAMFDRVVVEIVAMAFKIPLITNLVLPITVGVKEVVASAMYC
ncbi:MAG: hypothetical protein H6R26_1903, partial [Proteobacteria bacterium]|nr:hypothetical protein [Pseudomonadota bacterium]